MKTIKEISEMIEEELEGAENYAKNACYYKEVNPELAKTFYDISLEEMRHVDILHERVVELIERHKRDHGEAPAPMQAIYDFLHQRDIEWATKIKLYQSQYKES